MAKIIFRTVMVVGDNSNELIKTYDLDTRVKPYIKLKRSDALSAQTKHLNLIESIIKANNLGLTEKQRDVYKNMYLDIKEMDEAEYFAYVTRDCYYDDENGDAMSIINPQAYYKHVINPQKRLDLTNEEHDFANPFILIPLEGEEEGDVISYTAKKSEIDWSRMHLYNKEIYKRAWELCVDDDEPQNDIERTIKQRMGQRMEYFDNFDTKEDYILHSCSFWCYGYLDKDGYKELDYTISDKEWVKTYYDRFVKPLDDNETLSIYVVRAID